MAWLTGEIPDENDFICRRVRIPNDQTLRASVTGALLELAKTKNWEKFGDLEPDDAALLFTYMLQDFLEDDMCGIGKIEMYARDTLPPNVLPCDGSEYNASDYPRLYEVLPDALKNALAETFTTPDLRDRFILAQGVDNPDFGAIGGESEHAINVDEMPIHTHVADAHSHTSPPHTHGFTQYIFGIDIESVGVPDPTGVGNPRIPESTDPQTVTIDAETVTIQNEGGGEAHNNMPPFYVALFGIVAR